MSRYGIQVDGARVRFWSLKRDAVAGAKAIGWSPADVCPVHTRFSAGRAISDRADTGPCPFLSRERYANLLAAWSTRP